MKFVREYVPDKRWQIGQRPINVESNYVFWALWKLSKRLEHLFFSIRKMLESKFKTIDDSKEDSHEQSEQ